MFSCLRGLLPRVASCFVLGIVTEEAAGFPMVYATSYLGLITRCGTDHLHDSDSVSTTVAHLLPLRAPVFGARDSRVMCCCSLV